MGAKVSVLEKDGRYHVYLFYDIVRNKNGEVDKQANAEFSKKLDEFGDFIEINKIKEFAYPYVPKKQNGKTIFGEYADCKLPKGTTKEYIDQIENKCKSLGIEFKEGMPYWI